MLPHFNVVPFKYNRETLETTGIVKIVLKFLFQLDLICFAQI